VNRILASEKLIRTTRRKFTLFSLIGIAIIIAISTIALSYHESVIQKQENMNQLHKALSKQILLIRDIAIFSEQFDSKLAKEQNDKLRLKFNLLIKSLHKENETFFQILKATDSVAFSDLEKELDKKGLRNAMQTYLDRAKILGTKEKLTDDDIKKNIEYLSNHSRVGVSDLFTFANRQVERIDRGSINQLDNMGSILVSLCLFGVVLSWFFGMRPVYSAILFQHEKLKDAIREEEKSSRSRSEFIANISHEIRTPMTAILGYAEKLENEDKLSREDRKNFSRIMKKNADHLMGLIDEILDVSKIESGKLKIDRSSTDLPQLLSEVYSSLNVKAQEKEIDLRFINRSEIPKVISVDAKRLKQILFNIIGNAIKFTEKGYVELIVEFDNRYNKLKFLIKDTGCGISEASRTKLFRPFEQIDNSGKRQFGGTGLGLVLSKSLAKQMGGDVVIAGSRPGVGTTFQVEIESPPVSGSDYMKFLSTGVAEQESISTDDENLLKGRKLLVVDDAKENARLFKMNLTAAGASVELAYDGFQALEKINSMKFDLVLLDIQMPGKDGYETLDEIKNSSFSSPIVALTAHGMKEEKDKMAAAGFNGLITKPVKADVLISSVVKYLNS